MKRARFARRGGLTPDAERLTRLATGLSASSSRVEDAFWEQRLTDLVEKLLEAGNEDALNAALDQLWRAESRAYDDLADFIEAGAEGLALSVDGRQWDAVLFAAPVLAWSRYSIPSGPVGAAPLRQLGTQLNAHVLADHTKFALADLLFSPDQLPRSYADTRELVHRLVDAAMAGDTLHIDPQQLEQTVNFLSDTRYVIGVVAAPRGEPLFRWQEADMLGSDRETVLNQWRTQGGAVMQPLLPGCVLEVVLPNAYHAVCRDADRASRPYSLRASVAFLETTLNVRADQLRAVVAPFHDKRLEEYRIGFTLADSADVVHGVVWALLGTEDENADIVEEIERALKECGVHDVLVLDHRMPMEYCDDCGAPLYPDPDGQPAHAELPESALSQPAQLH